MKRLAKVSSKGQITLPKELRDCLGIQPHDRVELALDGDRLVLRRRERLSWRDLKGILPATGVDPDELIRIAKEDHVARKYGGAK
jgi:antitoxin PrlF